MALNFRIEANRHRDFWIAALAAQHGLLLYTRDIPPMEILICRQL